MRIEAVRGDLTTEEVDAIVNAANSGLLGGGGVDGAIHRAAGPRLLQACRELRSTTLPDGLPVGEAVATPGFDLPARWVIHTVGPNRHAGQTDPSLLRAAFRSSLELAQELGCRSVALPAISAGIYGWDADAVAQAAVAEARALAARADTVSGMQVCGTDVVDAAQEQTGGLELVRFVLFSDRLLAAFQKALAAGPGRD
ncbi:O-acetyl-ADP-ribose deacetylase [Actinomyces sp. MRS3W]|uniref:O-acetyl-ADP-ribose deacetylase n=1 Tax=Actinomyces sp. MRS3W TaxID=2800796 RepID=UPI0028FD21FA|nr:O-acetyl-ADP-ribose deacetylase [Actinomyces sp. MRS3W]MDU0347913.1 O-acetyl-ADP-ribose deacetylase [Actinomyces sp. MRS3W]